MVRTLTWGCVRWQAARVVICGQGPSWQYVDVADLRSAKERGAKIIAVNGAIDCIGDMADFFFTLDPSPINQSRMAAALPGVHYVAAVPDDYGRSQARQRNHRREPPAHVTYLRRLVVRGGLSENPEAIHTYNSAYGALGLAYLMGATRIVLLGVDGFGRTRWDGTQNLDLDHLPVLFSEALAQLAGRWVVNASPDTHVQCFPVMHPADALRQL